MKRWVLVALSAVLLMAVGWGCDSPGKPARIVFTSGRDYKIEEHPLGSIQPWHSEIYIMEMDGSNQTRLTDFVSYKSQPAGSPDGSKIAFASGEDSNLDIYVMNTDGSDLERLTDNPNWDFMHSWSPDGSKIAYISQRDDRGELWVMNADGTNQTRLTDTPVYFYPPAWSPDGTKLIYCSADEWNSDDIYIINSDGTGNTKLTDDTDYNFTPAWSPDGKRISYCATRDSSGLNIYVMNADGSEKTRITDNPGVDILPDWSPDNKKLVFYSRDEIDPEDDEIPRYAIFIMDADGSNLTRLSDYPGENSASYQGDTKPRWSPDGNKIVFQSDIDGKGELFIMNADGSNRTRLTYDREEDEWPAWLYG